MADQSKKTSKRKLDHISICLRDDIDFRNKTNGFDKYEFEHFASTEVDISAIDLTIEYFNKIIDYPFLISCMTGGADNTEFINRKLAEAAAELNIPIGVGSQRQALENEDYHFTYKAIRDTAASIPVMSNIGASEVCKFKSIDPVAKIIEMVDADVLVIHLNPLQELLQPEGNTIYTGLLKKIEQIKHDIELPIIAKEVGSGIGASSAKKLLDAGIDGIDVAGAGGTSWAAVEIMRRDERKSDEYYWDWGLPTSYCIKNVSKLKSDYNFMLIGSGGIKNFDHIAKALVLGADMCASARILFKSAAEGKTEDIVDIIKNNFENVKKIMYLTGCSNLAEFRKINLIKKEELY